ncbi:unnamed protein product [Lasius platythorax]|uniref:Uncharacterized protein n=1 Tax=Lasius platythorax TaxID=488582 RepID=A0AAV2NIV4_9HYME
MTSIANVCQIRGIKTRWDGSEKEVVAEVTGREEEKESEGEPEPRGATVEEEDEETSSEGTHSGGHQRR